MKINNQHKKQYFSPYIEEVVIDHAISMMEPTGDSGGLDEGEWPSSPSPASSNPIQAISPSEENNPFGGNTITY